MNTDKHGFRKKSEAKPRGKFNVSAFVCFHPCPSVVHDLGYNFQRKVTILQFGRRVPFAHNAGDRSIRKLDYDCKINARVVPFSIFYMGIPELVV